MWRFRYWLGKKGRITHIAIWGVALSDEQIAGLDSHAPQLTCTEHLLYFDRDNL